jgi:membrane-associated phospholipid phosphatase
MFPFERLAIVYFGLFGLAALVSLQGRPRAWRAVLCAVAAVVGVLAVAQMASVTVRVWMPHVYLIVGYWLPAFLVGPSGSYAFEAWLIRSDARLRKALPTMSGWTAHLAELSYLMCYPAVPVACAIVWTFGNLVDAEQFWGAVLAAGFLCYGSLPWLPSRPPRLLDSHQSDHKDLNRDPVGRLERHHTLKLFNVAVLSRVSHQFNTFPSGHVAVSVAAAAIACTVSWPGGLALATVAVAVAAGAIAGRYHYVVDVLLGVIVGVIGVLVVFLM